MNSLQEEYEHISYPVFIHPQTHPARLGAAARLFGLRPADPRRCRVLEFGCSQAGNLLTMAGALPESRFLGLNFSGPDIAAARELQTEAGLTNVELRQQDLLTFEPRGEKFDYIIAHGLFSWVPDEVKGRMLALCRECLAPEGVAYISYITYPGEKEAESLRDLLRLRTEGCTTPAERTAAGTGTLQFLEQAWNARPGDPFAASWSRSTRRMQQKDPHSFLLDDLAVQRDPCYLLQFTGWAAEHGLQYVTESEFFTMLLENLPPAAAQQLAALKLNRLETEQFIDFVTHRSFRMSLLTHQEVALNLSLDGALLPELCLATELQPLLNQPGRADETRFRLPAGKEFTLRTEPLVAMAKELIARSPSFVPFAELLAAAQKQIGRDFTEAELKRLRADLVSLYGRRLMDISMLPVTIPPALPERPRLSAVNRALVRQRAMVASGFHKAMRLQEPIQKFAALLDGRRSPAELRSSTAGRALGGDFDRVMGELRRSGCLE